MLLPAHCFQAVLIKWTVPPALNGTVCQPQDASWLVPETPLRGRPCHSRQGRVYIGPQYVARLRQSGTPSRAKLITLPFAQPSLFVDKVEERIRTECGSFVPLTSRY
jgi:hypothetical protein